VVVSTGEGGILGLLEGCVVLVVSKVPRTGVKTETDICENTKLETTWKLPMTTHQNKNKRGEEPYILFNFVECGIFDHQASE
jgi:hypothetical protein